MKGELSKKFRKTKSFQEIKTIYDLHGITELNITEEPNKLIEREKKALLRLQNNTKKQERRKKMGKEVVANLKKEFNEPPTFRSGKAKQTRKNELNQLTSSSNFASIGDIAQTRQGGGSRKRNRKRNKKSLKKRNKRKSSRKKSKNPRKKRSKRR